MDTLLNELRGMVSELEEARKPKGAASVTVGKFLTILTSAITQHDMKQSRKSGYNPYALGHMLGAAEKVDKVVDSVKNKSDKDAMDKLKKAISTHLTATYSPTKRVLKMIDNYVEKGKAPKFAGMYK